MRDLTICVVSAMLMLPAIAKAQSPTPIEVGTRLELFVDEYLIDQFEGDVALHLHKPSGKEVVLESDRPWEDPTMGYFAVFRDGDTFRMYYRGHHHGDGVTPRGEPMCYAESKDGIHWTKPNLGLFEFEGSAKNNIALGGDDQKFPATEKWHGSLGFDTDLGWRGDMVPFKDTSPNATPEGKYKALVRGCRGPHQVREGQSDYGMYPMQSPDGLQWTLLSDKPVITEGRFDSQNLAFWDIEHNRYVAFLRDMKWGTSTTPLANAPPRELVQKWLSEAEAANQSTEEVRRGEFGGVRDVSVAFSDDFIHWTTPVPLEYPGDTDREMYTNGILPYERAPHILLGFPTELTDSFAVEQVHPIFMTSRDGGRTFRRHGEPLIPAEAPQDRDGNRSNYMAHGIARGNDRELFVYATEGYGYEESDSKAGWKKTSSPPTTRLRRFVYRMDGFGSARAGASGGTVVTKPFTFQGDELVVNYIAWPMPPGELRIELQDADGKPLEGLSLADCPPLRGDAIAQVVRWKSGDTPGPFAGRPVRLRFQLRHADLFSFQFVDDGQSDSSRR